MSYTTNSGADGCGIATVAGLMKHPTGCTDHTYVEDVDVAPGRGGESPYELPILRRPKSQQAPNSRGIIIMVCVLGKPSKTAAPPLARGRKRVIDVTSQVSSWCREGHAGAGRC